jgi:hypothetical protein
MPRCQKDMLQLRSLSVTASCCGIAYNLLQPTPLWAPAAWGAFFISCHLPLICTSGNLLQIFTKRINLWTGRKIPRMLDGCQLLPVVPIFKSRIRAVGEVLHPRYYITQLLRDRVGITLDPDHEASPQKPKHLKHLKHIQQAIVWHLEISNRFRMNS